MVSNLLDWCITTTAWLSDVIADVITSDSFS